MLSCLDNIIGISETECECLIDGSEPVDYNVSISGLFLDRLDNFNIDFAKAADDCTKGGFWDRAVTAISDAKKAFSKDILRAINERFVARNMALVRDLGDTGTKGTASLTESYAGIKITPLQYKGGIIKINSFQVLINAAVNVTIKIYNNKNGGTLVDSFTTTTPMTANVANTVTLTTPIELPMYDNTCNLKYYVVLDLDGSYQPLNNKKDCGCGNVDRSYLKWLDFTGAKGNDVTDIDSFKNTTYLNGLTINAEMKCKSEELICGADRLQDFDNDSFSQYVAEGIRYKSAELMYRQILSSGQINRFTMANREYIEKVIIQWGESYMDCIKYLADIMDVDANDCMVCRRNNNMIKGGIFA